MYEVDFIGAGWCYPLGADASGRIALVTREREIEQSIRLILGTAIGERPMRPDFGCRIHDHVFGPANSATAGQVAYDVREALERWETRIEITEVRVSFDRINDGVLYVDIGYAIRGLNDPRNLVFPFYVIPDEGESTLLAIGGTNSSGRPALTGTLGSTGPNGAPSGVPGSVFYPAATPTLPGPTSIATSPTAPGPTGGF